MVGALAGGDLIQVARFEDEARAAILQRDAGAGDDDPAAEALIVRLDHRDHHPVAVGGAEVDRAASRGLPGDRVERAVADQRAAFGGVRFVQQTLDRDGRVILVGDIAPRVGEAELHRLDPGGDSSRPTRAATGPNSNPSRIFRAVSAAIPWPFGGISQTS